LDSNFCGRLRHPSNSTIQSVKKNSPPYRDRSSVEMSGCRHQRIRSANPDQLEPPQGTHQCEKPHQDIGGSK